MLLFDFPGCIGDYANCIGRTQRPGQRGGRVYAFLPEGRFWIAGELIALLEPLEPMKKHLGWLFEIGDYTGVIINHLEKIVEKVGRFDS